MQSRVVQSSEQQKSGCSSCASAASVYNAVVAGKGLRSGSSSRGSSSSCSISSGQQETKLWNSMEQKLATAGDGSVDRRGA